MNSNEAPIPIEGFNHGPNGYAGSTSPSPLYSPPGSPDPFNREQQFKGFYGHGNQYPSNGPSQGPPGLYPPAGMAPMMSPTMAPTMAPPVVQNSAPNFESVRPIGYPPGPILKPQVAPVIQEKNDLPIYGAPLAQPKSICGMRRKIFWVIVGCIVLLLIAGLGAGLGIALSKKKSEGSSTPIGGGEPTPTTTSTLPPHLQPTLSQTPSTPSDSPSPTPRTTRTPTAENFSLSRGYNTATLTVTATSGNAALCAYVLSYIPATTTLYPSIVGDADSYTAYWKPDTYPNTLVDVGTPPEPTETLKVWTFDVSFTHGVDGCFTSGQDILLLEKNGLAGYVS